MASKKQLRYRLKSALVRVCRERDAYRDVAEKACAELHGIGLAIGRTETPTHVTTEEVATIAAERDAATRSARELAAENCRLMLESVAMRPVVEAAVEYIGGGVHIGRLRASVRAYQSHASPGEGKLTSEPSPATGAIERLCKTCRHWKPTECGRGTCPVHRAVMSGTPWVVRRWSETCERWSDGACQCTHEEGDSMCPVHPSCDECGERDGEHDPACEKAGAIEPEPATDFVRRVAHSVEPMDFGSSQAIRAMAAAIDEREAALVAERDRLAESRDEEHRLRKAAEVERDRMDRKMRATLSWQTLQNMTDDRDAAVKRAEDAEADGMKLARQYQELDEAFDRRTDEWLRVKDRAATAEARVAELEAELGEWRAVGECWACETAAELSQHTAEAGEEIVGLEARVAELEAELAQARGGVPECVERLRRDAQLFLQAFSRLVRGLREQDNFSAADCLEYLATQPQPAAERAADLVQACYDLQNEVDRESNWNEGWIAACEACGDKVAELLPAAEPAAVVAQGGDVEVLRDVAQDSDAMLICKAPGGVAVKAALSRARIYRASVVDELAGAATAGRDEVQHRDDASMMIGTWRRLDRALAAMAEEGGE